VFNLLSLLISLAILFFVIRFRIHVHIVYQGSPWVASPRRKQAGVKACSSSTRALLPIQKGRNDNAARLETQPQALRHPPIRTSGHRAQNTGDSQALPRPVASFTRIARVAENPGTTQPPAQVQVEIRSALVNLGAPKSRARATAQKVCQQHPGADFDQLVRIAIQEVQAA